MAKNPNNEARAYRWNLLPHEVIDNILSRLTVLNGFEITISDTTLDIKLASCDGEMSQYWTTLENLITIFTSPSTTIFLLHLSYSFFYNMSFMSKDSPSLGRFINTWTHHLNSGASRISVCGRPTDFCVCPIHSVSHVKSLVLNLNGHTRFYNSPRKTNFPNLTHLILTLLYFESFEELGKLLRCHNLEVVVLHVTDFRWESLVPNAATFGLLERVKWIELDMKVLRFEKQLLNLALYLLKSTPILEMLSLSAERNYASYYVGQYDIVDEAQFFRSILEHSRISGNCRVEFLGGFKPFFSQACRYDKSIQPNLEST